MMKKKKMKQKSGMAKIFKANQLAEQMVLISIELTSVKDKAKLLAIQMERSSEKSVEILRKVLSS